MGNTHKSESRIFLRHAFSPTAKDAHERPFVRSGLGHRINGPDKWTETSVALSHEEQAFDSQNSIFLLMCPQLRRLFMLTRFLR